MSAVAAQSTMKLGFTVDLQVGPPTVELGEGDLAFEASQVRAEGFDVQYKQALTFLPNWARGVQVFANGAVQRFTGEEADNFANFIPRTASWGISLSRPAYTVKMNWSGYHWWQAPMKTALDSAMPTAWWIGLTKAF